MRGLIKEKEISKKLGSQGAWMKNNYFNSLKNSKGVPHNERTIYYIL